MNWGLVAPEPSWVGRLEEERLIGLTTLRLDGAASGLAGTQIVSGLVGVSVRSDDGTVAVFLVICRPRALLGATAFLAWVAFVRGVLFLVAATMFDFSTAMTWLEVAVSTSGSEGGIFVFFDGKGSVRFGGSI